MEILEKLQAWLGNLPFWEGELPEIDKLSVKPGAAGLFPQGQQVLSQKEDVLGNRKQVIRYTFLLKKDAIPGLSSALWCARLQEAAKHTPPQLGQTAFYAQKGRLTKLPGTGLGTYEIQLMAEMEETL